MQEDRLKLEEPSDYFTGHGRELLPSPRQVLIFLREHKNKLQQHSLLSRSHHRCVLIFNLGTEGRIHLDDKELSFKPGQVLQILPYQFHHYSRLKSAELRWLFCTFELEDLSHLEPLRNRVLNSSDELQGFLAQLLEIWHLPAEELRDLRLQNSLLSLLLSLRQLEQKSTPPLSHDTGDSLLCNVNQLLAQWSGRKFSIADVAEALDCSSSWLRVNFKQVAGITIGAYIKNFCLNRAMALLRTSKKSLAEIALEAGFASPQAFSRTFKQETGQTPRSYRQQG